jgi:hypothetical protein
MAQDSTNLHIKGIVDRAALVEQEALEPVSRAKAENSTVLSSARADAEDYARKVILLKDELVEERQAMETSEREHREHFEELTLLQTRGYEVCHAIIGPPRARQLSEGMRLAALCHTEIAGELTTFRAAVSFTAVGAHKTSISYANTSSKCIK